MKIHQKTDIFLSILLHVGIVSALIVFAVLSRKKFEDPTYVEVSFGLNENLVQTQQIEDKKLQQDGEREALKSPEVLPQLTKESTPVVNTKSDTLPDETVVTKSDLVVNQKEKPVVKPKEDKLSPKDDKAKPQNENITPRNEIKDFLKRKEEDMRKVGAATQTGKKNVAKDAKVGRKHSVDDVPRSPFETLPIPNAPTNLAPTGQENGTNVKSFDMYKLYLRNQLKIHWNIPTAAAFSPSLGAVVSFIVNEQGYLVGKPKIMESSNNSEFDRLVVEAVSATFPVTNPPPKEIRPPQTFFAKYNSKDVR